MRTTFFVLWLAALVAITVGSLVPTAVGAAHSDKLMHLAAYGLLSGLTWPAFSIWDGRRLMVVALALVAFGFGIEFAQPIVGRQFAVADGAANTLGVLVGIPLGHLVRATLQLRAPTT